MGRYRNGAGGGCRRRSFETGRGAGARTSRGEWHGHMSLRRKLARLFSPGGAESEETEARGARPNLAVLVSKGRLQRCPPGGHVAQMQNDQPRQVAVHRCCHFLVDPHRDRNRPHKSARPRNASALFTGDLEDSQRLGEARGQRRRQVRGAFLHPEFDGSGDRSRLH